MGAGGGSPGQAACLRQILLLQLDLIEQQQQQLQAKERQIEELKAERDTLLARIERMERRVQLVKKDSEREKHRIFQGFEVDEKPEAEACEKLPLECPQDLLEPPPTLQPKHFPYGRNGKGHKRKPTFGSAERKTPVKKLVSEFSKVKSKTPKHSPGKEESSGSLSETVCKRELRSQETPEKPRSLLETPLRASAPPKGPGAHPKEKGFFSSETDDLPYLSTTEMYLCRWHQPPPSPLPLREPSPKKEETVAIPSWRDHVVEPLRDPNPSDLLENLDDSVFSKRHAKLELDEKRRKRWDIQRIREQRILQRLQLRMYKRKGIQESEPEVTSFFPEPDDGTSSCPGWTSAAAAGWRCRRSRRRTGPAGNSGAAGRSVRRRVTPMAAALSCLLIDGWFRSSVTPVLFSWVLQHVPRTHPAPCWQPYPLRHRPAAGRGFPPAAPVPGAAGGPQALPARPARPRCLPQLRTLPLPSRSRCSVYFGHWPSSRGRERGEHRGQTLVRGVPRSPAGEAASCGGSARHCLVTFR
ncbi:male-specific lethal 1 homolog isoform X2 [Calonectris borealis]|uniref:male-specific lethal 1 homolog isoform X2 n=1 Tax=Calonectris borealis TaxID=1323832 RepID=UPI003F4BB3B3